MTVKLNELQHFGEVASNLGRSYASYTIVFEIVKQNIMIDGIKGLKKIKENTNGMFIAIKSKGDFFHIGQSMLTKWNLFTKTKLIIT